MQLFLSFLASTGNEMSRKANDEMTLSEFAQYHDKTHQTYTFGCPAKKALVLWAASGRSARFRGSLMGSRHF